jgi:hypothetical protein
MKSRDFCYWLQGMFELTATTQLDAIQTDKIKRHLALVFKHEIDPQAGDATEQVKLNVIHAGIPSSDTLSGGKPDTDYLIRC